MFTRCSPYFPDVEKSLYSPDYYKRIHKELTGEDYVSDYDGDDSLSTSDSSNDGKGS
ncbi:unnamed protein product [Brassica rapa]|uniref:Uncharacterized protein n=1 Tax=Brassica campestris TaxID=3711 RepID=M4F356_BRACM|nr:unnamed protein product [Brassica rapa]